uniref:Uncharacterized protein n=1 Tax=viral metagenome TaxID=1070528 RepID=A0A6C0AEK2_9ZZZZ
MNEFTDEYDLFMTNLKNKLKSKKLSVTEKKEFLIKLDILEIKKNCSTEEEQYDFLIFILKHFMVFSENYELSSRYIDENNYINTYTIYKNKEKINTEKEEEFIKSFLDAEVCFSEPVYIELIDMLEQKNKKCCIIS